MAIFMKAKNWYYQHRIEAFGYILAICLILTSIDVFVIKHTKAERDAQYEAANSVYVKTFVTSLSAQEGEISKIYRSTDGTKIAIMLKFNNIGKVINDASKYQIFFRGYDLTNGKYARKNKSNPSGGYVVFQNSGISMIYLYSADGFGSQACEIVVRCNDVLSTANQGSEDTKRLAQVDSSYANFDQFRLIVNPAGADIQVSKALDQSNFDAESLYRDAFVAAEENKIRKELKADIDTMYQQLVRINEYYDNLVGMKVMVPDYDMYIQGDSFQPYNDPNTTNYTYQPNNIMEGGVAYAWWGYTLKDGSFLDYKPANMAQFDDASYIDKLGIKQELSMQQSDDFNTHQVRMANGELVQLDDDSPIQTVRTISTVVNDYIIACNAYIAAKQKYLCTDMKSYCVLEYNMKTTGNTYSINMNPDTVTVWN